MHEKGIYRGHIDPELTGTLNYVGDFGLSHMALAIIGVFVGCPAKDVKVNRSQHLISYSIEDQLVAISSYRNIGEGRSTQGDTAVLDRVPSNVEGEELVLRNDEISFRRLRVDVLLELDLLPMVVYSECHILIKACVAKGKLYSIADLYFLFFVEQYGVVLPSHTELNIPNCPGC